MSTYKYSKGLGYTKASQPHVQLGDSPKTRSRKVYATTAETMVNNHRPLFAPARLPFLRPGQTPPHVLNIPQQFLCVSLLLFAQPCDLFQYAPVIHLLILHLSLVNYLCDFPIPLHSPLYLLGAEVAQEEIG